MQRAHLKKGEVLLVTGAGGGVNSVFFTNLIDRWALLQFKLERYSISSQINWELLGATVIAVASTPEKLQVAKQVGADYVINYASEDLKDMVSKSSIL